MDWLVPLAFGLDLLLGDPRRLPHPVVLVGRLVERLEIWLRALPLRLRTAGVLLTILTLLGTGAAGWLLLAIGAAIHPLAGWLVALWLAYTTLALRSLHQAGSEVIDLLEAGRIEESRRALALIVGRETAHLDAEGIVKACIETTAENTSDGVIAPLFYLFLGGPLLALLYKAASTLDSMVGYRNDRYREFGWASARLDDLLNLLPARLTALLMVVAAPLLGLSGRGALRVWRRDGRKPASPNAGLPQAAAAGALGVRLGGTAVYFGRTVEKPIFGDGDALLTTGGYRRMAALMYVTSFLALLLGGVATWLISAARF